MDYYVIEGPFVNSSTAFAVKKFDDRVPEIAGYVNEIYQATLFKYEQDAQNAIDEMPHRLAKKCQIRGVSLRDLPRAV